MDEVKDKDTTIGQRSRLRRAIVEIKNKPIRWLVATGKVVPFVAKGRKMYMYRLTHKERLIFSIVGNQKVIHDLIDIDDL